jgi:hypothetical protein
MDKLPVCPAGCQRYYFNAIGKYYVAPFDGAIFSCVASKPDTAISKFGRFVTSLLKQPITHV